MMDFDDDGLGGLGGGLGGGGGFGGRMGGRGGGAARSKPKVPVSILCGFLGAGKTTMVRHILRNREGLKVGIVVNDVAEANVDSEVLAFEDADGIVGLQNGCACCSGRDDLFARLAELVDSTGNSKLDRNWDRLVVECSGVAEPESIARELEAMGQRGEPVMKRIFLAGIICVVDASTFSESYNSTDRGDEGRLPLSALLVSQLESADTVIVNKADLVDEAELRRLSELLTALSPRAKRMVATNGALPLRQLLPAEPVELDMPAYVPTLANRHSVAVQNASKATPSPQESHGHGHEHGHSHGHGHGESAADCSVCSASRHDRFGLSSFVYRRSDGLFCGARLAAAARSLPVAVTELGFPTAGPGAAGAPAGAEAASKAFEGVVRSKGFVRVDGGEGAYYWSHAGRQLQVTRAPPGAQGKGQEIVFIGIGMDKDAIVSEMDACLAGADEEGEAKL